MNQCATTLVEAQAFRDSLARATDSDPATLAAVDETIGKLVSFYVNTDLDRRVDLSKVPLPIGDEGGLWPRVRLLVFSKGTLKLGKRIQKYAARLATGAACFAVVGVSAPALANGTIAPLFAALTDFRVLGSAEAAAKTLAAFANSQPLSVTETVEEVPGDPYPAAARQFVRALARPELWNAGVRQSAPGARVLDAVGKPDQRELGRMMVREALLSEYVAARPGAGVASESLAGLAVEPVQSRYRRTIENLETDPSRKFAGLTTRVEGYLRTEGARNPSFAAQLRTGLAEFRQPAQVWDFASAAVGDTIGQALEEALPPVGSSDLRKLPPKVGRTAIKSSVERVVEIKLAGFLENLRRGVPVARSLAAVARPERGPLLRTIEADSFAARLDRFDRDSIVLRDGMAAQAPSLRIDVSDAERARVRPFAAIVGENLSATRLAGALGNYDALFEANARSASTTALAALDTSLADAAGIAVQATSFGGGGPDAQPKRGPSRFQLARSSAAMRRSFRVGGVVIGAMPRAGDAAPTAQQLGWTRNDRDFELSLLSGNGRRMDLGRYSGELVQLALAYAADARTVAVTMTAPGLIEMPMLRVHLHPALVDTRIGRDIIALDRFVDEADSLCKAGMSATRRACTERERVTRQLDCSAGLRGWREGRQAAV